MPIEKRKALDEKRGASGRPAFKKTAGKKKFTGKKFDGPRKPKKA
jgi:hypothetical protein